MTKKFSLIYGAIFLIVGILGFIPGLSTMPHAHQPDLAAPQFYGNLLGLFPVNWLHNLVHVAIGIWGLVAAKDFASSRTFARSVAVFYGVLTVMGLIPATSTTFGFIPIFGHDIWLHALAAGVAAYFGFVQGHVGVPRQRPHAL